MMSHTQMELYMSDIKPHIAKALRKTSIMDPDMLLPH